MADFYNKISTKTLANLYEVLVRQWPTGKLRELAADLERSKIDSSETNPFDEGRYLSFAAVSSPE